MIIVSVFNLLIYSSENIQIKQRIQSQNSFYLRKRLIIADTKTRAKKSFSCNKLKAISIYIDDPRDELDYDDNQMLDALIKRPILVGEVRLNLEDGF